MSEWDDRAPRGAKSLEAFVIRGHNPSLDDTARTLKELDEAFGGMGVRGLTNSPKQTFSTSAPALAHQIQTSVLGGADPSVGTTSPAFAFFPELPEELRLKIWKLALPGPHLVDICSYVPVHINGHRSAPSILHVCSESRKEALKWYTAVPLGLASAFRAIYVNCQIDTLYFNDFNVGVTNWAGHGPGIEQVMNNVRFVAINCKVWDTPAHAEQAIHFIQRFRNLEELTIVVFDFGKGEITDEYELDVWDEWKIGDEVGVAIRKSDIELVEIDRRRVERIKTAVMTRERGRLKNLKVRIAIIERVGQEKGIQRDRDDWEEEIRCAGNDWEEGSDDKSFSLDDAYTPPSAHFRDPVALPTPRCIRSPALSIARGTTSTPAHWIEGESRVFGQCSTWRGCNFGTGVSRDTFLRGPGICRCCGACGKESRCRWK